LSSKHSFFQLLIAFFLSSLIFNQINAQDNLPHFNVALRNDKINISWINKNSKIIQVNIQRSSDSLTGFKTIASIEQPKLNLFEFIDTKSSNLNQNYRLYILEEGGNYQFTNSQKPVFVIEPKPIKVSVQNDQIIQKSKLLQQNQPIQNKEKIDVSLKTNSDPSTIVVSENIKTTNNILSFNDTRISKFTQLNKILSPTKLLIFNKQELNYPHIYTFINPQGQLEIVQPLIKDKLLNFVFYKDDGNKIFVLINVKENQFVLDKTNFLQSGWFYFELYEKDKLITKQKFYLPK
jgi:hypothetical protein